MYKEISSVISYFNYSISREDWEHEKANNPDFPEIDTLAYMLNQFGVKNYIVKVPDEVLGQLPNRFFSAVEHQGIIQSCIVDQAEDSNVKIHFFNKKRIILSKEEFLRIWTGFLINIEQNNSLNKIENKKHTTPITFDALLGVQFFALAIAWLIYVESIGSSLLFLVNFTGLLLSWSAFKVSLGFGNEKLERACSYIKSGNCSMIIRSPQSKIFNDISLSDLSLAYFFWSCIITLLSKELKAILALNSLLLIPLLLLVAYAIYQQSVVVKRKCLLCYSIIVCCILQILLTIQYFKFGTDRLDISISLFILLMSFTVVFFTKGILSSSIESKFNNYTMSVIYNDRKVFGSFFSNTTILKDDDFKKIRSIELNTKSSNNLTYILSPNCDFCKIEFKRILKILKYNSSDICVRIALQVNNHDKNTFEFIERLSDLQADKPSLIKALEDYFIKGITVKEWLKKWGNTNLDPNHDYSHITEIMNKYKIPNMPVVFANRKMYPAEYDVKDVRFFINDLFNLE